MPSIDKRNYYDVQPIKAFAIEWTVNGLGDGIFTFYYNDKGEMCCDNQQLSKEIVKGCLSTMIDNCIFTEVNK